MELKDFFSSLDELVEKANNAESIQTLLGYEGTAAGKYFEAYKSFFPRETPFEYRSRRPPHNPPNAILSFGYSILASEIEAAIYASGLDPAIGFFHEPSDGRPSLALDIMEPFRAPIIDALALDLLSHSILKAGEHFESRDGGCYLNKDGKKRFFTAYEKRLNRDYFSEQRKVRTCLREEIKEQISLLKRQIMLGEEFYSYLMN